MEDSGTGGSFLFWNEDKFSVLANVNRRTLERAREYTDMSWYIDRVLPALFSLQQHVDS